MTLFNCTVICFLFLYCASVFSASESNSPLTVQDFSSLPDIENVKLSPDGRHVVYRSRVDSEGLQGYLINVRSLDSGKDNIVFYGTNDKLRLMWIAWANDRSLMISVSFPEMRYGTPTTETRLLILDIKTKKYHNALSHGAYRRFTHSPQFQDQVIDFLPDDSEHFMLQIDGATPNAPSVYRVSVKKGGTKLVKRSRSDVKRWITDTENNVRLGIYRNGTTHKIIHSSRDSKKWTSLWEFESFSSDQVWPIGFAKNPDELYVTALHEGRDAIFLVNLKDERLSKKLIYANDHYDVEGDLFYSNKTGEPVGIKVSDSGGYIFWDDDYKALMEGINKGLPHTNNNLISFSRDEKRYIVLAQSDTDPGLYYFGDRDKKTLVPMARRYKKLLPNLMRPKEVVSYRARDGLDIEAYLTLPEHNGKTKKFPTVIFPHGGPLSYDGRGFDYWTQYFANAGYAVLQMNFRGSSGYGHEFMSAGLKNWGLAMQDDVEDGTRWMIEQGYSDPDKICIVGASYGGYAALMGVVRSKGLYQCVVSFAGVTDVAYMVKSHRNFTNYAIVKEQVGSDFKSLKQRSPLYHASDIDIPTLLIHGTKDRSVKYRHTKKMYKALKKAGKSVELLTLEDGNHYLSKNEHRVQAFEKMDAFLGRYLH